MYAVFDEQKPFLNEIVHTVLEECKYVPYKRLYKEFAIKYGLSTFIPMKKVADAISGKKKILDATGDTPGVGLFLSKSFAIKYHIILPLNISSE